MKVLTSNDDNGNLEIVLSDVNFTDYRTLIDLRNKHGKSHYTFQDLFKVAETTDEVYALPEDLYARFDFMLGLPIVTQSDFWNYPLDKQEFIEEMAGGECWHCGDIADVDMFEVLIRTKKVSFTSVL
jgi:hypothetical protein